MFGVSPATRYNLLEIVIWGLVGLLSIGITWESSQLSSLHFDEAITRYSARLSLYWYWLAGLVMLGLKPRDWLGNSAIGRLARWSWTWGAITFLFHLVIAFHFYHHWSHTRAIEHVYEASGVGEGIFVSYFFTGLWVADTAWWWINPNSFATRSPWIGYAIHAFMIFIVVNATIVFETGTIRWIGVAVLMSLTATAIWRQLYFLPHHSHHAP